MLTDSFPPSKDTVWQTGLKRKTQQSVVYRRLTSLIEISTGCVERLEEDLPSQWPPKTGRRSNTYLGQSRLQTYIDQTR
jgi:hypothetical protein